MGAHVVDAHHHRMRDHAGAGRAAVTADVRDDHRTVTEPQLSPVVLADPHPLDEPEGRGSQATASRTSG